MFLIRLNRVDTKIYAGGYFKGEGEGLQEWVAL